MCLHPPALPEEGYEEPKRAERGVSGGNVWWHRRYFPTPAVKEPELAQKNADMLGHAPISSRSNQISSSKAHL